MAEYLCRCCGVPIDWPPLDYGGVVPLKELGVPDDEISWRVVQNRDFCVIDNKTFLMRGNVQIPIKGSKDTFAWGVWCSVSENSFNRIEEIHDSPAQLDEPPFFAWLLTTLPCYSEPTAPVKARLHLRGPCVAPYIEVWPEHPLGKEQIEGMSMDRVWEIAKTIIGDVPPTQHERCQRETPPEDSL